jgi:hypothetical protein
VLGPTTDGGFYLIGFRREKYSPAALYAGATANEKDVGLATLESLASSGLRTTQIETLGDLDTAADLRRLTSSSARVGRHLRRQIRRTRLS